MQKQRIVGAVIIISFLFFSVLGFAVPENELFNSAKRGDLEKAHNFSFFIVQKVGRLVRIKWEGKSPLNLSHFEIERRNGATLEVIGIIEPERLNTVGRYLFEDHFASVGTNSYRLKIVYFGQKIEYTESHRIFID